MSSHSLGVATFRHPVSNSDVVRDIDRLQASKKIELIELNSPEIVQNSSIWCFNSRFKRNICRVSLAGALSSAGACLGGFLPTACGIIGGSILGGVGNGASTWLAWEKKSEHLIRARIRRDFPALVLKVSLLNERLLLLAKRIGPIYAVSLKDEAQAFVIDKPVAAQEQNQPWYWRTRNRRNGIRLFVAGALSGAGGWLGGFVTSATGIVAGGVLGGIGNAVSTWLAFEQTNDKITRKSALEFLPKLVQITEESETRLTNLIERIGCIDFAPIAPLQSVLERTDRDVEGPACCMVATREWRNFIYVNAAGWLSAAGGLLGGFFSNTAGTLIGGAVGATANSISTWLAWEKEGEREIERVVLQDFPKLALKIVEISKQIRIVDLDYRANKQNDKVLENY
jgi:hypothetical protein